MLRRVLVATDGSEHARRAEAFAARFALPDNAPEIQLLYVYPQLAPPNVRHDPLIPWHLKRAEMPACVAERAEAVVRAAEARVRQASAAPDLRVWCRFVASSDVAGVIAHEAERSGVDLIVLGGRDHHGFIDIVDGGGVCSEVRRRTARPVVLVP